MNTAKMVNGTVSAQAPLLRCATWNVHRARGGDGRVDPRRIVGAIEAAIVPHRPDVLALQEADGECPPHAGILDISKISRLTGLHSVHDTPALRWGSGSDGFLGTILWVHPRFDRTHADVLDLPGHCHRGAISVELLAEGLPFRVMSMHLSLTQPLRVAQMRIVGQYLLRRPAMQTILLGDFNEWRPWGGVAFGRGILGRRFTGAAHRTFPARRPILPLDRILTDGGLGVTETTVLDHPQVIAASDHRPLVGAVPLLAP